MAKLELFVNFVILIGYCQATKFCEMLIAIDQPLLDKHYHGNLTNLTDSIRQHVTDLNEIYKEKITGDQLLFSVKEIQIFNDFCSQDKCNEDKHFFLEEFEKRIKKTTEPVCIAHIFTYRDFPHGYQGLANSPGACQFDLSSGKITNHKNAGFTTILNHGKPVEEYQTSLTFAHEIGHNLDANHNLDKYGKKVIGTLMGAKLGRNITISNLKIGNETKKDIGNYLTEIEKGIRYELYKTGKTENNRTLFYINKWPQDDQDRFKQGYYRTNCFKDSLTYSNDDGHFMKLRQDLENQVKIKTNQEKAIENLEEKIAALTRQLGEEKKKTKALKKYFEAELKKIRNFD